MSTEPPKPPESRLKLNSGRIVLLVLGVVLLLYIASAFLGGLTNYQQLKEGALEQKAQPAATTPPAPAPAN
jgi:hypothetical protein